jgi:hypothetical protein
MEEREVDNAEEEVDEDEKVDEEEGEEVELARIN